MDILTQGILGAALAQSGSRQTETRIATFIGFAAGLLADADVFIQSSSDSLLNIEYHRHFTHSIFFIPIGALIATALLWLFVKNRISFQRLYWFSLLGYSLSGFLDACTSYGTHLFWPLSDERISLRVISIVDPVFTVALILAVVLAYRKRRSVIALYGLMFAGLYLSLAFLQLNRAESVASQLASERGHSPERVIAKPTMANIVLWRSIYKDNGRIYIDAIRVGSNERVYAGESVKQFNIQEDLKQIGTNTVLYKDIKRFNTFSDGYIALHPDNSQILGDVRYSVQTNSIRPIWGIEFDLQNPQLHASFKTFREFNKDEINQFSAMLMNDNAETSIR